MKTKSACQLLLLSVLCSLFLSIPAPAYAGVLEWEGVDKPGLRGNIVVTPSEVSEIAVGRGGIVYALDSVNSVVYRSDNGGSTWEDITSRLVAAGASLPATRVALAPDTSGTAAVVTDSGTRVYVSTDGGVNWVSTNVPALAGSIQTIAISRQYTEADQSLRDIAIGTAAFGDSNTTGQVWVFPLGSFVPVWKNQSLAVDPGQVGGEVAAIAFSPGYQRDGTIIVVAATGNDVAAAYQDKTWLCLGKRDTVAETTSWSAFSGYPVEIATSSSPSSGDDTGVLISASLALPADYSATDEDSRLLFVSYNREPDASDDVYRLNNTTVRRLSADGGDNIDISSIAYYGTTTSGKLLAGDVSPSGSATVRVRRTVNPLASAPAWNIAAVPPSGPGNAMVAWSTDGGAAYCGTGQSPGAALDESAFSLSSDGGDNWQQQSLMDTVLQISDLVPSPNSDTLFIATYSSFGPEGIWRSAQPGIGEYWSRQMTLDTASNRVILRLSPEYASDYTIYAAEAGGELMAVSNNRGSTWKKRLAIDNVVDIAVEDANTLYAALPGGNIAKSTNGGFTWGERVTTGLSDINMLAIAGKGTLLVGGRNGEIAYSQDGGTTFARIKKAVGTGDVQVIADASFEENSIIYAATSAADSGIWRGKLNASTDWQQIDESMTSLGTGQRIGGMVMAAEGTLYASRMEPASISSGGMTRSLNPAAGSPDEVEFSFTSSGLPAGAAFDSGSVFTHTLPYIKLSQSGTQNDVWSLDTVNEVIYRFQDTLSRRAVMLAVSVLGPPDNFYNPVNKITGRAGDITFSWLGLSSASAYNLEIASDSSFNEQLAAVAVSSSQATVSVMVGPDRSGGQQFNWVPGMTYYWRVRETAPIFSAYSVVRSIVIGPLPAQVPSLLSPANGGTGVSQTPSFSWSPSAGASEYRFILADNVSLGAPVVEVTLSGTAYNLNLELQSGQTYYWAVKVVRPVESDWSAVASFTVEEKETPSPPPVVVEESPPPVVTLPAPPTPSEIVIPSPEPAPAPVVPAYVWAIIITGIALVGLVIGLIVRSRRV